MPQPVACTLIKSLPAPTAKIARRCCCAAHAGMALATLFVTMPFVVRELLPVLEQMDMAEEEAAR
jgi:ABC-type sulfate transport system permease subunit